MIGIQNKHLCTVSGNTSKQPQSTHEGEVFGTAVTWLVKK